MINQMEHDEKVKMYNKLSKRELIELLINSESVIGSLVLGKTYEHIYAPYTTTGSPIVPPYTVTSASGFLDNGEIKF